MIKLNDKDYTRNLHYHFGQSDKTYYESSDTLDKEQTLYKMIEHWERMLMLYKGQGVDITSLEQLVDDLHIVKLPNKKHEHYKKIKKVMNTLHQLNSWYEEVKTKSEWVLSGDE